MQQLRKYVQHSENMCSNCENMCSIQKICAAIVKICAAIVKICATIVKICAAIVRRWTRWPLALQHGAGRQKSCTSSECQPLSKCTSCDPYKYECRCKKAQNAATNTKPQFFKFVLTSIRHNLT